MKALPTQLTPENIATTLHMLAAAPERLDALCAGHDEQELRREPQPGERSVAEILAHMLHAEARSAEAITLALLLKDPLLAKIHPERDYGKLYRYDRLATADLLAYYRTRREILLNVLSDLKEAQWSRTVHEEGKARHESVYLIARTIVMHEQDHLGEIGRILGEPTRV